LPSLNNHKKSIFDSIQKKFSHNRGQYIKRRKDYLLRGIIKCSDGKWRKADNVYMDKPFISTHLQDYLERVKTIKFEKETKINDDHLLHDSSYSILELNSEKIVNTEVPALNAVNERLRDDYIKDCDLGVRRWNKIIEDAGIDFRLKLPHRAFHRGIGQFSEIQTDPEGEIITQSEWDRRHSEWMPSQQDQAYVQSLMQPVTEPGKIAGWIAPPRGKINRHPFEYEFVRFN